MRLHRKVWLWRGSWWAAQLYVNRYISFGVHADWSSYVLDLHVGWLIIAIGKRPSITANIDRYRESCRGFEIEGSEAEAQTSPLIL